MVRSLRLSIYMMFLVGTGFLLITCGSNVAPIYTPQEALKYFHLADSNIEIRLVAAEPLVQDPVAMTFDMRGNLWVVEMLGFMPDIDGIGEDIANGRVSVLFDDDGDGTMDRKQIFLDSLHLPRAIAIVEDGILIAEQMPLWIAKDLDGDFRADEKILIDSNYGGMPLPEHSANGLWRGLDGWIYNAKSKSRYREIGGIWIEDETEFRGQWGICHDDEGRLFYNYNWSQLHADLVPPNYFNRNPNHQTTSGIDHGLTLDRKVYPIRSNLAVNRGYVPGTLDAEGKLLEFASACAPFVYRGGLLGSFFQGNAFVCEPTANLIVRNIIEEDGFSLSAKRAYPNRDFLTSSDERFRPIFLSDGPDGALYFVDMYRGIIQHGPYMSDYLRKVTLERNLDKHIHLGRIWKIVPKGHRPKPAIDLSALKTDQLIEVLDSENGWMRDQAQFALSKVKEEVLVEEVKDKAMSAPLASTRMQARWILHHWKLLLDVSIDDLFADIDPSVLSTTIRLLAQSPLSDFQTDQLTRKLISIFPLSEAKVKLSIILNSHILSKAEALPIIQEFLDTYCADAVARDAVMSALSNREFDLLSKLLSDHTWSDQRQFREIFLEMLASAIINLGDPYQVEGMLGRLGKVARWQAHALLQGMANHNRRANLTIPLAEKPGVLADTSFQNTLGLSEESLRIVERILDWPGKPKSSLAVQAADTKDIVVNKIGRNKYVQLCASCHGMQGRGLVRFAPPLRNSEWVIGDPDKLVMILLHGMQGPIKVGGKMYDVPDIMPAMPSISTVQNQDIAAIATYIRTAWGHQSEPIKSARVSHIRYRTQGKLAPWTAKELLDFTFDENL